MYKEFEVNIIFDAKHSIDVPRISKRLRAVLSKIMRVLVLGSTFGERFVVLDVLKNNLLVCCHLRHNRHFLFLPFKKCTWFVYSFVCFVAKIVDRTFVFVFVRFLMRSGGCFFWLEISHANNSKRRTNNGLKRSHHLTIKIILKHFSSSFKETCIIVIFNQLLFFLILFTLFSIIFRLLFEPSI